MRPTYSFLSIVLSFCRTLCAGQNNEKTVPVLPSKVDCRESCLKLLKDNLQKPHFSDLRFYDDMRFSLSYVRIGSFISANKKSAVIIYTPNDTSIAVELYSLVNNKWTLTGKETNMPVSWLSFDVAFLDYDFDKITDIYINVSASNGTGLKSGYLLTVTKNGNLILHPETIDINDMVPDKKSKTIKAKYFLNCLSYRKVYEISYRWNNAKLEQVSPRRECEN